jgi:hypothetical protein
MSVSLTGSRFSSESAPGPFHHGIRGRGGRGQALSDYPPLQCRCRSRARASLRNRHQGPSIMGSEDEVEEVKHFQTIRHCNVGVAHGLALLFGIGTRALPSWDPRTRWNNLTGGLALPLAGPSDRADSPHPSSREGHHSTAGWSSSFLLLELICHGCHAAGTASRVQRKSVPSTQMRCRMTASRRARATIAFFIPRRLAICIAQALSQDHFFERNRLCAAS